MGGGSSKSETKTSSTQTSEQQGVEGVVGGDVNLISAKGDVINQLPKEVSDLFASLIGVVDRSLDLTGEAGQFAIQSVAERVEQQEQPELSIVRDLIPVLMVASVGLVAFLIIRKI